MDSARSSAFALGSSLSEAWKVFRFSGFCVVARTYPADRGTGNGRLSLVAPALLPRSEPVAVIDRSIRDHALALCLYRSGDQTVVSCLAGRLSRARQGQDPHVVWSSWVFNDRRSRNLC